MEKHQNGKYKNGTWLTVSISRLPWGKLTCRFLCHERWQRVQYSDSLLLRYHGCLRRRYQLQPSDYSRTIPLGGAPTASSCRGPAFRIGFSHGGSCGCVEPQRSSGSDATVGTWWRFVSGSQGRQSGTGVPGIATAITDLVFAYKHELALI